MRVLITGATGIVGREIVTLCHQSGISVHYLTTKKDKLNIDSKSQGFLWNPEKGEIDLECFDKVDVIIHLAGASIAKRWTKKYQKEIFDSRVQTAALIYSAIEKNKFPVRQVISASAIGIYPDSLQKYYTEDAKETDQGFLGTVVKKWEASIEAFSDLNIDVTLLRIGLVLSNKGGAFPKIVKPITMGFGSFFGSGKQWQSWIHVNDLARMFVYVIKEGITGVFNAVAPDPVTNEKMTTIIADKLEVKLTLPNIPRFAMNIMLGKMHILLYSSQRVSCQKILDSGYRFIHKNVKSALDELIE